MLGDVAGDWWVYPGANIRGYSGQQPVKIAQGYYGTTFAGMGDWDETIATTSSSAGATGT